jgi:hypothetical protein
MPPFLVPVVCPNLQFNKNNNKGPQMNANQRKYFSVLLLRKMTQTSTPISVYLRSFAD